MRKILGLVGALLFVGSAQSATMWNDKIGNWSVGAYTFDNKVGGFSHCAALASYQNGILLMFSVTKDFHWTIGFANPKWNIRPGTQYNVSYWVDNGPAEFATPTAIRDDLVLAVLPDNVALFNSFRYGHILYVKVRDTELDPIPFNLTSTSQMLTFLLRCAQSGGVKPSPAVVASPNMFGTSKTAQATPTDTKSEPPSVAQKAEATLFAANLVSELGITGFKFLRSDEMPKGITADAMWAAGKTFGTVNIIPTATDINAIGPILIGRDAQECKKAFASGAMPVEEDSKIASLFTRCGLGKEALVSFYLVAPRKAGGVYVVGTYGEEQEDSVKTVDSGVKTAVFHAMPK
jgi:hypothetical protein